MCASILRYTLIIVMLAFSEGRAEAEKKIAILSDASVQLSDIPDVEGVEYVLSTVPEWSDCSYILQRIVDAVRDEVDAIVTPSICDSNMINDYFGVNEVVIVELGLIDDLRSMSSNLFQVGVSKTKLEQLKRGMLRRVEEKFKKSQQSEPRFWFSCDAALLDESGVGNFCFAAPGGEFRQLVAIGAQIASDVVLNDQLATISRERLDLPLLYVVNIDQIGGQDIPEFDREQRLSDFLANFCPDCGGGTKLCGASCPTDCNGSCTKEGDQMCCLKSGMPRPMN
jgi:hypothetical protein